MKNLKNLYQIFNKNTGKEINENELIQVDILSATSVVVKYDFRKIKKIFTKAYLQKEIPSVIKYQKLFPLQSSDKIISLQEGNTPLYKSGELSLKIGLNNLYFKFEGLNPTGAFKDRGSVIEISKALLYKARAIVVASTGNMAASVSAYCAKAKIPCFVFIPKFTPESKLAQTLYFGSKIIKVDGAYDNAAKTTIEYAKKYNLFLTGDYVLRTEGQKTQAYEIIVQLNFQTPDYVIVPVGNGTNIYAIWKGFKEFYEMGIIDKLPKMIAVQAENYDAIYQAHRKNKMEIKPIIKTIATVASAIAVKNPSDANKVLQLLKDSKGDIFSINDREIIQAQSELARTESIFAEPSSVTVIAGLKKLLKKYKLSPNASIVCLLSGNGLKDPISGLNSLTKSIFNLQDISKIENLFKMYL